MSAKNRASFGIVQQLPSGNWRARYTVKGLRYKAPHTFDTEADAEIWLARQREALRFGTWVDPAIAAVRDAAAQEQAAARVRTLGDYAVEWLATRTNSRGELLRVRTRSEYERLLRKAGTNGPEDEGGPLAPLVVKPVGTITAPQVRAWRAGQMKTGTKTQTARAYALLSSIMKTAVADHVISENPCAVKGGSKTTTGVKLLPPTDAELVTIPAPVGPVPGAGAEVPGDSSASRPSTHGRSTLPATSP